jgi:O-antigen/teichoic acid export membrane protein
LSRRFLGNAAIYIGANCANAAVPFLLLPILTRVLTPEDYGIATLFALFVSVAGAFTGLSLHGAVSVRFFQLDASHFAGYVGACVRIVTVSTLVIAALVALTGSWLESLMQVPREWLIVAVLVSGAQGLIGIRLSLWQVQHRAGSYALLQVGQSVTNAGLSLLLVLVFSMGWQGRTLGQALGAFIFVLLALVFLRGSATRPQGRADVSDALRFGVPLIPHVIGGLAIATADRVLISNMLDVSQAGIYTVALQIGMAMGLLTESFNRVYAPWLMETLRTNDVERNRRIVLATYAYFVAVTFLALLVGFAAPWLMSVLVGEAFRESADVVLYIALGFAFGGMYYMVTGFVFFASKTGQLALLTFASGIFNIAVTWLLIRANGLSGAAQGFMLSQAALFLGTWWLAQRVRPMPWRQALFDQAG